MADKDKSDLQRIGDVAFAIPGILMSGIFWMAIFFVIFLIAGWVQHTYFSKKDYGDGPRAAIPSWAIGAWNCSIDKEVNYVIKFYEDGSVVLQEKFLPYPEEITIGSWKMNRKSKFHADETDWFSGDLQPKRIYFSEIQKFAKSDKPRYMSFQYKVQGPGQVPVLEVTGVDAVSHPLNGQNPYGPHLECVHPWPGEEHAYDYLDKIKADKSSNTSAKKVDEMLEAWKVQYYAERRARLGK